MISKAVGYSGFRTYGELPYPTRKQGKQLELANKIWESTVRPADYVAPLENYHNSKTVYAKSFLENTYPEHYHPEHVPKGGNKTIGFENTAAVPAYDRQEAKKYAAGHSISNPDDPRKANLLKTGTQHWRTVYQQSLSGQAGNNVDSRNTNLAVNGNQLVNGGPQSHQATVRSQSLGAKSKAQLAQQQARANSYKTKPYINNAKTGVSDYKFNYGQKIGSSPMDLMGRVSIKQPLVDNPLKRGTNQLWTEIPNYQGFKPSQLSFKQYQEKIGRRDEVNKGNLKLQTAENFLVQTPGYGGFKPQFQKTNSQLRATCLGSTNPV